MAGAGVSGFGMGRIEPGRGRALRPKNGTKVGAKANPGLAGSQGSSQDYGRDSGVSAALERVLTSELPVSILPSGVSITHL